MSGYDGIRHSKAENVELVTGEEERATREAANAMRQTERVREYVLQAIDGERGFKLRPSIILDLNREAIIGLDSYAGNWRPGAVEIGQSKHEPPGGHLVPSFIEELCDYVNDNWQDCSVIHLGAMVMWRLNWIHPFTDGNGRTSRATSYLVICAKSGSLLPGKSKNTITDQILANRSPYYEALEAADKVYEEEGDLTLNTVKAMEDLIAGMLANQLTGYFKEAEGS
jgi:Fic family protein